MRLESMRIGCLSVRTKNNFGINKMISEPRYKRRMETNCWVSQLPSEQQRDSNEPKDW